MKDLQYDHINMLLYVSFFHSFQLIILIVSVICCRSTKGTLMRSLPRGQTRWLSTEFNTGDDQVSKLKHLSQILIDSIQNVRTGILQFPSFNMFTLFCSEPVTEPGDWGVCSDAIFCHNNTIICACCIYECTTYHHSPILTII